MCWWISKVDIWCGSPYPAKHLDDLSACRVRKCNDLSHQKYDFFSSPWNWNVTCTYFLLIWRTWHPKKNNTVSCGKKHPMDVEKFSTPRSGQSIQCTMPCPKNVNVLGTIFFVQFSPMDIHIDVITCAYACHAPKNKPTKNAVQWHNTATGTQSFFLISGMIPLKSYPGRMKKNNLANLANST